MRATICTQCSVHNKQSQRDDRRQ